MVGDFVYLAPWTNSWACSHATPPGTRPRPTWEFNIGESFPADMHLTRIHYDAHEALSTTIRALPPLRKKAHAPFQAKYRIDSSHKPTHTRTHRGKTDPSTVAMFAYVPQYQYDASSVFGCKEIAPIACQPSRQTHTNCNMVCVQLHHSSLQGKIVPNRHHHSRLLPR